jgi:exodeoxyribonuclease VII small subunit
MNQNDQVNKQNNISIEHLAYEDAFNQLEEIVESLEAGDHSLEEALSLYERGQFLARHCATLLDQAEIRVKQLSGETLIDFPTD